MQIFPILINSGRQINKLLLALLLNLGIQLPLTWAVPTTIIPKEDDPKYKELAESFKSGDFQLWQLVDYALYLIELLVFFAGGVAVLMIVIGGYQYMLGAISEDKESGKKTLGFAILGFVVCLLAWLIVNFIQYVVTSG